MKPTLDELYETCNGDTRVAPRVAESSWPPAWLRELADELSPEKPPDAAAKPEVAAFQPRPVDQWLPRPRELATWPVEHRQKWGVLANDLEDQGTPFPESERRAYHQVKTEIETPENPAGAQACVHRQNRSFDGAPIQPPQCRETEMQVEHKADSISPQRPDSSDPALSRRLFH
jgi:hypothetical protein